MLRSLTRQQRIALIAFVAVNAFIIIAAIVLLFADEPPQRLEWPDLGAPCEANAALAFRQRGVAASVSITRAAMLVTVDGPSAQAWDVFSATTRLAVMGCGPYNLIRVDVPDPEGRPDARLILELTGPELQLWVDGQLDDGQLAERMRRKLYQTLPFAAPTPSS
jgi:hypothetical protein